MPESEIWNIIKKINSLGWKLVLSSTSVINITLYEYNEIEWNTKELLPGLYFAEIVSSGNKQKIIKVVVGY